MVDGNTVAYGIGAFLASEALGVTNFTGGQSGGDEAPRENPAGSDLQGIAALLQSVQQSGGQTDAISQQLANLRHQLEATAGQASGGVPTFIQMPSPDTTGGSDIARDIQDEIEKLRDRLDGDGSGGSDSSGGSGGSGGSPTSQVRIGRLKQDIEARSSVLSSDKSAASKVTANPSPGVQAGDAVVVGETAVTGAADLATGTIGKTGRSFEAFKNMLTGNEYSAAGTFNERGAGTEKRRLYEGSIIGGTIDAAADVSSDLPGSAAWWKDKL